MKKAEASLEAIWTVLEGEFASGQPVIDASPSGVEVAAGEVLIGVDNTGCRQLLVPLQAGEPFADDLSGGSVHLVRIAHGGVNFLCAVCLSRDLDDVFSQFAYELLGSLSGEKNAAKIVLSELDRWRQLFSDAPRTLLSDPKIIGLLAELQMLESIVAKDPSRRIASWTGPNGSEHDFRSGAVAIEVKATGVREGRRVSISSVDQLQAPEGGSLHLAHSQYSPDSSGDSLPDAIDRVIALNVLRTDLYKQLELVGYHLGQREEYLEKRFALIERRVYDVSDSSFPRITRSSFAIGDLPPGTLKLTYQVDLSNEPPVPLSAVAVKALIAKIAKWS
jgi:hypothetical protein